MYIWNEFNRTLQSFVSTHAGLDIDIKLPTVKQHVNGHIRFYVAKDIHNIFEKLLENLTAIDRCMYVSDYILIWLKKDLWTRTVVREILSFGHRYGTNDEHKGTVITLNADDFNDSVTSLRIALLKDTVERLAEMNGCTIGSNGINLIVSKKNNPKTTNLILCGSVVSNFTVEEYKQQKQDAISKMSANRIESDEYPIEIISKLCHISIVYELLSVRHNKVVNVECNTSNKDKGIFIMYNYSRLCQIWAAYEKGVLENDHKSLPEIDDINFGLMTSEEEWLLIFNHLSVFPSVIQESTKHLLLASVDVHKLCKFLMEMSSAVSLFYHRHHILSDPIPNLLPLMYARLYLVKTSIQVYENIFRLLGIEAVREM